jgi:hypothetical protein
VPDLMSWKIIVPFNQLSLNYAKTYLLTSIILYAAAITIYFLPSDLSNEALIGALIIIATTFLYESLVLFSVRKLDSKVNELTDTMKIIGDAIVFAKKPEKIEKALVLIAKHIKGGKTFIKILSARQVTVARLDEIGSDPQLFVISLRRSLSAVKVEYNPETRPEPKKTISMRMKLLYYGPALRITYAGKKFLLIPLKLSRPEPEKNTVSIEKAGQFVTAKIIVMEDSIGIKGSAKAMEGATLAVCLKVEPEKLGGGFSIPFGLIKRVSLPTNGSFMKEIPYPRLRENHLIIVPEDKHYLQHRLIPVWDMEFKGEDRRILYTGYHGLALSFRISLGGKMVTEKVDFTTRYVQHGE